jgi:Tol biopolymer transport system component
MFCPSLPRMPAALSLSIAITLATVPVGVSAQSTPLRFVVSARQLGPVGYRDPLGVISPDGAWLAYTSGTSLRVIHNAGGPVQMLARFARIFSIVWQPDSRNVAAFGIDSTGILGWTLVDTRTGVMRQLWSAPFPSASGESAATPVDPRRFREIAWSSDGAKLAGIMFSQTGSALWLGNADGTNGRVISTTNQLSFPKWTSDGKSLACLAAASGRQQISIPCGVASTSPAVEAYGPIAFSPDGGTLYYSSPGAPGTLDLYAQPVAGGTARRITNFARDSYAPSVARNGRVLFGTQDYRAFIAVTPAAGGPTRQLTAFQSETPSWSRDDRTIGFTYGTWRRVVDDLRYPDIAQDLGLVGVDVGSPAAAPTRVIRASTSEDQGLDWSPDGRWIVFHSHAGPSDDVWLQPADGSSPARQITRGGYETGWPRWSPDGRWIAYSTQIRDGPRMRGAPFILGVNAATGEITSEAERVPLSGITGDIEEIEWLSADSVVILAVEGLDRQAIYVAARAGGPARLVHRFTSEQRFAGLGVARAALWAAYIAPAPDGHFQVFRVPLAGGAPTQVTTDPTDKTQPSVSHDGSRIAFTVYFYETQFWVIDPR